VIASGRRFDALQRIVTGEDEGTLFLPKSGRLPARKRWIAFYHRAAGTLVIDDGARTALCEKGRSLLAPGIRRVDGEFGRGQVVRICDVGGREIARGIARLGADEIRQAGGSGEVVHRDDLVVL